MYKILILSCINSKKNGEARDSEADLPSSKLHESQNNSPNSPKLPSKGLSIICLSLLCFWSLGFHHNRYVILIRKATLRWEHLEGVRKTSIWGSNIYFCAFRNWGMCLVYTTSSSHWLGNAGEDVINENRFHNCVLALLVPVSTKGYHCRSWKLDWTTQ